MGTKSTLATTPGLATTTTTTPARPATQATPTPVLATPTTTTPASTPSTAATTSPPATATGNTPTTLPTPRSPNSAAQTPTQTPPEDTTMLPLLTKNTPPTSSVPFARPKRGFKTCQPSSNTVHFQVTISILI